MPLVVTQAIVLHAFDYLESSRVLRLITREAGVQSVLAKGARRTRGRVGTGVDLFAEGEAQIYIKPTRELHTLGAFDVTSSRIDLAMEMSRFLAASALAELALRVAGDEANPSMYDNFSATLDAVASASGTAVVERGLAGAWRLIADAGFTPSLDACAACHKVIDSNATVAFSHPAGGVMCETCARFAAVARKLPPSARHTLRRWEAGESVAGFTAAEGRAHQRLLREFVYEHVVSTERSLRAFAAWESEFGGGHVGRTDGDATRTTSTP